MSDKVTCPVTNCSHIVPQKDLSNLRKHLFTVHSWSKEKVDKWGKERKGAAAAAAGVRTHVCTDCGQHYSTLQTLNRHKNNAHRQEEDPQATAEVVAGGREEGERPADEPASEELGEVGKDGFECPIEDCTKMVKTRMELCGHCEESHKDVSHPDRFTIHKVILESKEEFEDWRDKIEEKTVTNYTIDSEKSRNDHNVVYYWCSRANKTSQKGKNQRAEWRHTEGRHCSAFLTVRVYGGEKHEVTYCAGHCGHPLEPGMLRIPKRTISLINYHLDNEQEHNWILKRIKEDAKEFSRSRFLTHKDISNLVMRNGGQKWKYHDDDLESARLFESMNPGSHVIIHNDPLKILLVSDKQLEWARKYGERVLAIDDTFHVTKYNLRLCILAVMDDVDRTLPIGYFFSSTMSENDVYWCLLEMETLLGHSITPKYFMSDDTSVFWNALTRANPACRAKTAKLLCIFHVLQAVKRQVPKKITDVDIRKRVVSTFRSICAETSPPRFLRALLNFLEWLNANDYQEFLDYIRTYYLGQNRLREWAPCYRRMSPIGVNCGLERLNSRLKHQHLKSSGNSRLDNTMFQCVAMTNDIDERNMIADVRNLVGGRHRLQATHTRHQDALKQYKPDLVKTISPEHYEVTSSTGIRIYNVTKYRNCPCKSDLNNHCTRCLACPYSWVCQCPDSRKAGTVCKHVHAVFLFAGASQGDQDAIDSYAAPSVVPVVVDEDGVVEQGDVEQPVIPEWDETRPELQDAPINFDMGEENEMGAENDPVTEDMVVEADGDRRGREAVERDDWKRRQMDALENIFNDCRITLRSYQKGELGEGDVFLEELKGLLASHGQATRALHPRNPRLPGRPSNVRADEKREQRKKQAPIEPVTFDAKSSPALCAICHSEEPPQKKRRAPNPTGNDGEDEEDEKWHYCVTLCKLWMHDSCIAQRFPAIDKCYYCKKTF